jgi:hypothetical protein
VAVKKSTESAGLSLIVRKEYIMGNTQPTATGAGSGKKADISDALTKSPRLASMVKSASQNSRTTTTATMQKGLPKTWKNVELEELRRKAGLVAGALADFQAAGGLIVRKEVEYTLPSGRTYKALRLHLIVENANLVAETTPDGIDFSIVAETQNVSESKALE